MENESERSNEVPPADLGLLYDISVWSSKAVIIIKEVFLLCQKIIPLTINFTYKIEIILEFKNSAPDVHEREK